MRCLIAGPARRLIFLAALASATLSGTVSAQAPLASQSRPRIIVQNGHAAAISAAAWTADGKFLLTGSSDGQILLWDLAGRIVSRIALDPGGDRTVVERIVPSADGRGAQIDEIWFRDMWDNGVGSEVWRRRYALSLGDAQVTQDEAAREQIASPWPEGLSFLQGSLALKSQLINKRNWPKSALGWGLAPVKGQLAMIPPQTGARPVILNGALGFDPDQGDAALEARARRFDLGDRRMQANAAINEENLRNCGQDDRVPCAKRKPFLGLFDDAADQQARDIAPRGRPLLSPDGMRLAWIDRSAPAGGGSTLWVLEIERGRSQPMALNGRPTDAQIGWTDATTLSIRADSISVEIDVTEMRTGPARQGKCYLPSSGQILPAETSLCPDGQSVIDARQTYRTSLRNGFVDVTDTASGRFICTAYLEETEIVPAAFALVLSVGRQLVSGRRDQAFELISSGCKILPLSKSC